MQISLTAEQEAQLSEIAAHQGRAADELAREVFSLRLAAETRFVAAVEIRQDAAAQGDFVETSDVWTGVERAFRADMGSMDDSRR